MLLENSKNLLAMVLQTCVFAMLALQPAVTRAPAPRAPAVRPSMLAELPPAAADPDTLTFYALAFIGGPLTLVGGQIFRVVNGAEMANFEKDDMLVQALGGPDKVREMRAKLKAQSVVVGAAKPRGAVRPSATRRGGRARMGARPPNEDARSVSELQQKIEAAVGKDTFRNFSWTVSLGIYAAMFYGIVEKAASR